MGSGVRVHFFDDQDNIQKIPYTKFNHLISGGSSDYFNVYSGKRVRCSMSFVEIENRKVIQVSLINYMIIPFALDGNLDKKEYDRGVSLSMKGFDFMSKILESSQSNVMSLTPKISQKAHSKEFKWTATQENINAIISDILPS